MRIKRTQICGYFLLACAVLGVMGDACAQPDGFDWQTWGAVTDTLPEVIRGARIYLSAAFIVESSEKVTVNGERLTPSQYEINYQQGLMRINSPLPEHPVVVVEYVRLPFLANSVYSLRKIEISDTPREVPPRDAQIPEPPPLINPTGDLVFGGVKSISFSTGNNRGTDLDQTLRVTIEGHLTSSIKVKALLSDDNLPVQPEGNTEELQYLDKVFVELTGPKAKATLGDFSFQNSYSSFSSFRRELKGVWGQVGGPNTRLGAVAGQTKGEFRRAKFRGTSGLQGPYELVPEARVSNVVIIAGTERVYVDGQVLQRGLDRDFTIDYERGTVTFTPRRVVTEDTEIAVDFEVTQERYDRTSVFSNAEANRLPGGFSLAAIFSHEEDDPNKPKAIAFDDADRQIIAESGDAGGRAIAPGVTKVEPGEGQYVQVPADTVMGTPAFFVYNDSLGDFIVAFVVGKGKGDYVVGGITRSGLPYYRFDGIGNGTHVVGRALPLPESHTVITTRIARSQDSHLFFDLQYNVSEFDANTLSDMDDDDNVGDAGELQVGLRRIPLGFGRLSLDGTVSTILDRFKSMEDSRHSYFYRDWNLENEQLVGREILQEYIMAFAAGKAVELDYKFGTIKRGNFDGSKHEAIGLLAVGEDRRVRGRVFTSEVGGDDVRRTRQHGRVSASYGLWHWLPSVTYGTEEYLSLSTADPDSGIAYDQWLFRMAKRHETAYSYAVEFEQRDTRELADTTFGFEDSRTEQRYSLSFMTRRIKSLQGELTYSHRIEDDKFTNTTSTTDLARLKGLLRVNRIGFRSNFNYQINQTDSRVQQKTVIFVGEGQGDYNEQGEPVGSGRGDYTVVFLNTLKTIPTRNVSANLRFSLKGPSGGRRGRGPVSWLTRNVSLRQSISIQEETTFSDALKVYLFFPSALQRNNSTLFGLISVIQDWSLLDSYSNWSLTFHYERTDEEDNRFGGVKEDRFLQQQNLKLRRSLSSSLSANAEVRRELRRRGGEGLLAGTGSTYDVEGWTAAGGVGLRFSAGSTLDGTLEAGRRMDAESGAEELTASFISKFVWRLTRNMNIFGGYDVTLFDVQEETGIRPVFFATGGTRHRWRLTPNLRVSKMISILGSYEGRSERTFTGKRILDHNFRLETRAIF